jgi:hypothetical protein
MTITYTDDDDDDDADDEESAPGDFLQSYLRNLQEIAIEIEDDDDDASATKLLETIPPQPQHHCFAKTNATTARTLEELMEILPTANVEDAQTILLSTMGTMALCRGEHGKKLHQAGAVVALTQLLYRMRNNGGNYTDYHDDILLLRLMLPILAAIRDLSCGNPTIRADFHHLLPDLTELLFQPNNGVREEDAAAGDDSGIASSLPFQTALVGTIRNLAHSNGRNGRRLHELGVTTHLVLYLQQFNAPPPPSSPDRELYFRSVGTILAIVEKVDAAIPVAMAVTEQCLMDESLSSSSSKAASSKLYHPGLLKLIRSSHERQPQNRYATLLQQEAQRQVVARLREEQRLPK